MDETEVGKLVTEVTITYSVRELLSRIEERQVRQDEKINSLTSQLVSRSEHDELKALVSTHEAFRNRALGMAAAISLFVGGGAGTAAALLFTR